MKFLHYESRLDRGDVAVVKLSRQANVKLMDDDDFASYRAGRSHHYFGGLVERSPFRLVAPHAGNWHVTVDLGGYSGSVEAGVRFITG